MKTNRIRYIAVVAIALLSACSSAPKQAEAPIDPPLQSAAAQSSQSSYEQQFGGVKVVFDASNRWQEIIATGTATPTSDSRLAQDVAFKRARAEAHRHIVAFINTRASFRTVTKTGQDGDEHAVSLAEIITENSSALVRGLTFEQDYDGERTIVRATIQPRNITAARDVRDSMRFEMMK